MLDFWQSRPQEGERIGGQLLELDAPMLLVRHRGCLLYTDEGFEDAAAALPDARSLSVGDKPSTSKEFAALLETFCRQHVRLSA
jgi:hypothetical protein